MPGRNVLSVALGGDDPDRYAALVVFAHDLIRTPHGPCRGPRGWQLRVRLAPGHADTAARLRALGPPAAIRVDELERDLASPLDYATERYRVHDDPDVRRWVAVDPHYLWGPRGAAVFRAETARWRRSGRPHLAYAWPGLRGTARPYAGGFVGAVPARSPVRDMGAALAEWRGPGGTPLRYGDDERFLGELLGRAPDRDLWVVRRWPSSANRRMLNRRSGRWLARALARTGGV